MRDTVCPIGECTATVRFEAAVVEVTPRYRLHDLGEVDEFATCPECEAEVAGFYPEDAADAGGDVELILDIDDDEGDGDEAGGGDASGDDDADGFDAPSDDFDDPDDVLDDAVDGDDAPRAGSEDDVAFGSER